MAHSSIELTCFVLFHVHYFIDVYGIGMVYL